ncbi:MAG: SDR family oxidoreductase [Bacteroidetes bacterium]|nr:SDR family oxidoreductase [Bacteroidota bacterium]
MKIAIFGASGRTGILTVYQALDKGHQVTAFARKPSSVTIQHKNFKVIQGDILDYDKVKQAVEGQDVVISALGVESRKPTTVLSEGTRLILRAMEECKVDRFICMSSAGILGNDAGFLFGKIIMPLFLKEVFRDKVRQMKIIQETSLDWVIIRPTGLTDAPKTGKYKITTGPPASRSIPRADVADFMLKLMTDKQYDRQMPAIAG